MICFRTLAKDRMRLYRHSTMCSTAMQMFLNCNRHYWCCVPMKNIDADKDDHIHVEIPTTINHPSIRTDEEVQCFINNLPLPPIGYRYSQRQHYEQYLFFKYQRDLIPPSPHLDLYNATIVFICT